MGKHCLSCQWAPAGVRGNFLDEPLLLSNYRDEVGYVCRGCSSGSKRNMKPYKTPFSRHTHSSGGPTPGVDYRGMDPAHQQAMAEGKDRYNDRIGFTNSGAQDRYDAEPIDGE
jgi:hypothetical protein